MTFLDRSSLDEFHENGFLIVNELLSNEESRLLADTCRHDAVLQDHARDIIDASGKATNLTLWNHPGDDLYGIIARSERAAGTMEQLLGDEVYHYHSKLSAKQAHGGGAWEWHQDYGYWYNNGCLFPDMGSLFIAIDACTPQNGCLQVLRGSHKMGRINHGSVGKQTGADLERVAAAKQQFELVHCEMVPGDGLFFHCNLLHASPANMSDQPRWGLICCYNTRHNSPYREGPHPSYTPLARVPDSAILQTGHQPASSSQKFLDRR